jgi:hypothetical protein
MTGEIDQLGRLLVTDRDPLMLHARAATQTSSQSSGGPQVIFLQQRPLDKDF